MKVELSDVPMTAALVKRHEAETAAIPMNPPPLLLMQHATRQAIELLEHAAFLERRCARPEAPRIIRDPLSPEEIERLSKLPMGPIEVVYPLDDEWNAAIDAAAVACDRAADTATGDAYCIAADHCARIVRKLKRQASIPSPPPENR